MDNEWVIHLALVLLKIGVIAVEASVDKHHIENRPDHFPDPSSLACTKPLP
jgi:hypothetical protein